MRFRFAVILGALVCMALAGTAAATTSHRAVVKKPIKITVTMKEFSFTFSRASVPAGSTVIFNVVNKGALAHDLKFSTLGKATPLVQPGKSRLLTVVFKKVGLFPYLCSVPRHAEQGMAGAFRVKK